MNDELRKFNAENNGYLLIVRTETGNVSSEPRGHASAFETDYFLNEYSNAGAILLCCYVIAGSIETHLGADKRALGIPILAYVSNSVEDDLKKYGIILKGPMNLKCLIYSNEFSEKGPEGFIASA